MAEAGLIPIHYHEAQKPLGLVSRLKVNAEKLLPYGKAAVEFARPLVEEVKTDILKPEDVKRRQEMPLGSALVDGLLQQFAPNIRHLQEARRQGNYIPPGQLALAVGTDIVSTGLGYFGFAVDALMQTPGMATSMAMEFSRVKTEHLKPLIRTHA